MVIDAQLAPGVRLEPGGAHGLAGLGAAQIDDLASGLGAPEVMIEGQHAVDLGPRQVELEGDQRHRRRRHPTEPVLDPVQDRQQAAGQLPVLADRFQHGSALFR